LVGALSVALTRSEEEKPQSLQLNADEIVFDAAQNRLSASGAVRVTSEALEVTCAQVRVALAEKERTIQRVEASGGVNFSATYRASPDGPTYKITSHSHAAVLLPQQRKFSASGEAVVMVQTVPPTQESYRLQGEQIDFDLATQTLTARKGVEQPRLEVTLPAPSTEER